MKIRIGVRHIAGLGLGASFGCLIQSATATNPLSSCFLLCIGSLGIGVLYTALYG